ncbi:MAG: C4-dicarboxylate ABC transporter [Bacteroides sp.]|nr:C4-dicarboxylate ABC transporter [Bacteroides sp.]
MTPPSKQLDNLVPLAEAPVQAYFSNRIQLAEVISWVLGQIGKADITISTFSTSEEFLRRFARIKDSGLVKSCTLFCDLKATKKTTAIYDFINGVFDNIYLCMNHSKVVLFRSESICVAVVTSQNQTRGDRNEAGVITTDLRVFRVLDESLNSLTENSLSIDDIYR